MCSDRHGGVVRRRKPPEFGLHDTSHNGHPLKTSYGEGPMEAVEEFLAENRSFVSDRSREKFIMTFSPKGFLKRIG